MTAQLLLLPNHGHLGGLQMRHLGQRFLTMGMMVALMAHALALGTYYLVTNLLNRGVVLEGRIVTSGEIILTPPPSLEDRNVEPLYRFRLPILAQKIFAIPKPVEEVLAPPDAPAIADQKDLRDQYNRLADSAALVGPGSGLAVPIEMPPDEPIPSFDKFIPHEQEPRLITRTPPRYPELAKEAGVGGKVVIKFWVDKKGEVKQPEVVSAEPSGLGFEEAALEAVKTWKFIPALQHDQSVGVWVVQRIRFEVK